MLTRNHDQDLDFMKIRNRTINPLILIAGALCLTLVTASAQTTVVTTILDEDDGMLAPDLGSGTSLREAILYSPPETRITFDRDLSGETVILSEQLTISQNLVVDASMLPDGMTLDANATEEDQRRVLTIDGGTTVELIELGLTGGLVNVFRGVASGAAIEIRAADSEELTRVTLDRCHLFGNEALVAGAIFVPARGSTFELALDQCLIENNESRGSSTFTISGGFDSSGTITVVDTMIRDNLAGGINVIGVNNGEFEFEMLRSTISGNQGVGLDLESNGQGRFNAVLTSCTISGNTNTFFGGGIESSSDFEGLASLSLISCTITDNSAMFGGGGIFVNNQSGFRNTVILENTILTGNTSTENEDDYFEFGFAEFELRGLNLVFDSSNEDLGPGENILQVADPLLSPLGNYGGLTETRPPLPTSPTVDAALESSLTTDQRGFVIIDGSPDIGAAELQGRDDNFGLDDDGDGNPNGLEVALGTNPGFADLENPLNLMAPSIQENGSSLISFGYNQEAPIGTVWVLRRSNDLVTFEEIFRIDRDGSATQEDGDLFEISEGQLFITDTDPEPSKAFYQFEALPSQ